MKKKNQHKKVQSKVKQNPTASSTVIKKSDIQPEKPSFNVKEQGSRAKGRETPSSASCPLPSDTIGRKIYEYVMQLD